MSRILPGTMPRSMLLKHGLWKALEKCQSKCVSLSRVTILDVLGPWRACRNESNLIYHADTYVTGKKIFIDEVQSIIIRIEYNFCYVGLGMKRVELFKLTC